MRILHLVHQYPPHFIGGTELYTQTVAAAQAAAGHDVAVFVPTPEPETADGELPSPTLDNGVWIYRIPVGARGRSRVFLQTFRQPRLRRFWQAALDAEQPDLVHIEHLMGLPVAAISDLLEREIPFVVTLHDYWYICANAQLLTNTDQSICAGSDEQALNCARCAVARAGLSGAGATAPLLAPLLKRRNSLTGAVLQAAGKTIAPTSFVRDIYRELGPQNLVIDVLPHGIKLPDKIAGVPQGSGMEQKDGRLRVGYIGSVAWQKGVHVLIEAVNALPEEAIELAVYGDLTAFPAYASQLKSMISRPGIELHGKVDRAALWRAIADLDVVVLPTLWYETSVLVIDEVHALGIPVIGSDIGVMGERIGDGVNGRLFPPGDVHALQSILSDLAESPATLTSWRDKIEPVFTIDEHISALEEIYSTVLDAV